MAIRKILIYPESEEELRKPSEKVDKISKQIKKLIQDLKDTLMSQPGAGLAAPQIGVHKRVTIVSFGQDSGTMEPPLTLINPEIIEEGPLDEGFDGCLSLPNIVTWSTLRPTWLRFTALNEQGEPFEMRVEGIDAILVHHEIDHLDGVLFMDRLTDPTELYLSTTVDGEDKLIKLAKLI